jgi:hypothetical protein
VVPAMISHQIMEPLAILILAPVGVVVMVLLILMCLLCASNCDYRVLLERTRSVPVEVSVDGCKRDIV